MSQHTELVPRLRDGADFHESEGDIGLPYLLRQAADTIEALSVNPLREALEEVWQQARENHNNYSATGDLESDLRFFALGLAGEAGELANFIKKRWRDGDGHDQAIKYEVADVCAYAFMLADRMGMTPNDLIGAIAEKQQTFIAKMSARKALGEQQP